MMRVSDLRNVTQTLSTGAEVVFDFDGDRLDLVDVQATEVSGRQQVTFVLGVTPKKSA